MAILVLLLVLSFFSGSIPFGFLVAVWTKGIDIRHFGSGNIGTTNVWRVVGKPWGILVFVLDFCKGALPVFAVGAWAGEGASDFLYMGAAVCAVAGHSWTPFLRFKGGKGVATSTGAVAGLTYVYPLTGIILLIALGIWLVVFLLSKYVSLASLSAGFVFFLCSLLFPLPLAIRILALLLFLFILVRHKKNIKNLFLRKEFRF
ncbi:MAG: glycerol-3-phosphate 1-O-acyltransferase PlsY [Candidatus Omnitrophica bacterium]|nr:glycerol-3-phosphate 1-O-acyltransferase PlsY [Candidatus Omnitrophota bacterium]